MDPAIVVGSRSPNGDLEAIVDQDDRVAYLYLRDVGDGEASPAPSQVRSCWIRNLWPGPASMNESVADMRRGVSPMMPRRSCAHARGAPRPWSVACSSERRTR